MLTKRRVNCPNRADDHPTEPRPYLRTVAANPMKKQTNVCREPPRAIGSSVPFYLVVSEHST